MIDKTSPLYAKRMAKAINEALKHGVYWAHPGTQLLYRIESAKTIKGQLFVKGKGSWHQVDVDSLKDGYGRHIVASLENKR